MKILFKIFKKNFKNMFKLKKEKVKFSKKIEKKKKKKKLFFYFFFSKKKKINFFLF